MWNFQGQRAKCGIVQAILEIPHLASGITISSGDISFETAIDVALASPSSLPVLIVGVDAYNEELKKNPLKHVWGRY